MILATNCTLKLGSTRSINSVNVFVQELCSFISLSSCHILIHHTSNTLISVVSFIATIVLIALIPNLIAKRHSDDSSSNPCRELAWFLTTGIVVSAFALPIVLARAPVTVVTPTPGPTDLSETTTTLAPVTVVTPTPGPTDLSETT